MLLHHDDEGIRLRGGEKGRRRDPQGKHQAAHRYPHRAQGHPVHEGIPHDLRIADPPQLRAALRRHGGEEASRRGCRLCRKDQHGRVRHGLFHGDLLFRRHPQSLGPGAHPRGLERRLRRGPGGRRVHRRDGLRHGRLHPPAGGALRCRGSQAHLRARLALRAGSVCLVARPDRPLHEGRGGLGHHAERHCRLRPHGVHIGAHGGARLPQLHRQGHQGLHGGDPEGVLHRGHRRRRSTQQ